ncbi:MAG: preprotein translocase subunit YajC [Pirellulaceae bacterium]|nr:preprotein translocase subunit YajC [Pirellulaceae bacterium]
MFNSLMMFLAQLEQDGTTAAASEAGQEAAAEASGGSMFQLLLPMMAALLVIMLLMRPKKGDQQLKKQLADLKKNDRVVTAGGIIGTVSQIRDDANYVTVRIDESTNAKMQIVKTSIVKVLGDEKAGDVEKTK